MFRLSKQLILFNSFPSTHSNITPCHASYDLTCDLSKIPITTLGSPLIVLNKPFLHYAMLPKHSNLSLKNQWATGCMPTCELLLLFE